MSMLEAECTRCKQIFVPHTTEDEDLIHGTRYDDSYCGGIGVIQGQWIRSIDDTRQLSDRLLPIEKHGLDMPHCSDPDCEFHHPEVREPAVTLIMANDSC